MRLYSKTRFLILFYINFLGLCKRKDHVVPLPLNNFRNEDHFTFERGEIIHFHLCYCKMINMAELLLEFLLVLVFFSVMPTFCLNECVTLK